MIAQGTVTTWDVPACEITAFDIRRRKYALVVPVLNEGDRIRTQLSRMVAGNIAAHVDVVIVDGGSADGSTDPDHLRSAGVRALIVKTGPGRLSAQLRCAYAWVLEEGYDGVVTIDGNDKDGVEAVPRFAEALDAGVGYAQASRFVRGGRGENTPLLRLLAIRLLHAPVLSLGARRWMTDTTQGFRAYSRAFLLDPRTQPFRSVFMGYELLAYLTVRAGRLGYGVTEIPTVRSYPAGQAAPTKIAGMAGHFDLLRVALTATMGGYDPAAQD